MANESIKVLQLGAFQLEAGLTGASQSPGWGETGSEETLGASDGFPYIDWPIGLQVNHEQDNSITTDAFKDVPRLTGITVEREIHTYLRFDGLGNYLYWIFGFENVPLEVGVFTLSTPSVEPVAGAVYQDTDTNSFTFRRKETSSGTTYYVFEATDSAVPTLQTGDLSKQSGTGDDTLTMTAHSALMYEHLLELDALSRHFVAYETAEQITGYSSGDKKNRMATLGKKMGSNDYRYRNAMCKGATISSSSAGMLEITTPYIAYDESRGDYSSSSWTIPTTLQSSDNIAMHHQTTVEIGTAEGSLTELAITDINVNINIPLQVLQDTVSGLYNSEPVFEGKYEIGAELSLARHTVETFQGYRDNWTTVVARIASTYGYYMIELLIQEAKVATPGPDDSDVAKEVLTLIPGKPSANNWSTWLSGNTLVQSGPIVMRVRNLDSTNHMFEI